MSKVHIVQLLCPSRHCIIMNAWEEGNGTEQEATAALKLVTVQLNLNPYCGICGSRDLKYECQGTKFNSLKEAAPSLVAIQHAEMDSRAILDAAGATHDAQQFKQRN